MSSSQGIETIDLTSGSPEPPTRAQTTHRQAQHSTPPVYKTERSDKRRDSRLKASSVIEPKNEEKETPPRSQSRPQYRQLTLADSFRKHAPSPPINPDQLRRIIDSSPPEAVNAVLLELCRMSPALSGAVARGLAPHSTYAQTIKKHHSRSSTAHRQARSHGPSVKTENRRTSQLQEKADTSRGYASPKPESSITVPDVFIPRSTAVISGDNAFFDDDSDFDNAVSRRTKTCKLCWKKIGAKDHTACYYHPRAEDVDLGLPYYGCCGKPVGATGCRRTVHDF